jgi:putative addiction module component (TIGR02574 family)
VFKAVSVTSISAGTMAATPIADLLLLPRGERLALAMALWDSLDDEARNEFLPVDATLGAELDRRWQAHLENPAASVPWDQVRSQLGLG